MCGLRNSKTQLRLLAESQLTFKKAFEMAQAAELYIAEKSVKDLQLQTRSEPVNAIKTEDTGISKEEGLPDHALAARDDIMHPANCRFKSSECYACGRRGHIAQAWWSSSTRRDRSRSTRARREEAVPNEEKNREPKVHPLSPEGKSS